MPGYPPVMDRVAAATTVHRWPDFFGGPAATGFGARRRASSCWSSMRRTCIRAPAARIRTRTARTGPTTPRASPPRLLRRRKWGADCWMAIARHRACPRLASGLGPGLFALRTARSARRPPPATILTVHNLAFQGQFPASLLEKLRCRAEAFTMNGVEYHGQIGFLKGGLGVGRSDHHGVADLRRGNPGQRDGDGARRLAAPSVRCVDGDFERHRSRRCGTRPPTRI